MSKADTLLKKAAAFERLALYSDRKAFLAALAQPLDYVTGPGQKMTIDPSKVQLPPELIAHDRELDNVPPPPAELTPAQLRQQELASAMSQPGMQMPTAHITGRAPQWGDKSAVTQLQNFLNRMLSQGGKGQAVMAPIAPDGKWGPETAAALKLWGKTFKVPAQSLADLTNIALSTARRA